MPPCLGRFLLNRLCKDWWQFPFVLVVTHRRLGCILSWRDGFIVVHCNCEVKVDC